MLTLLFRPLLPVAAILSIALAPALAGAKSLPASRTVAASSDALTVGAHFLPGTDSLLVRGTAPAGSPVLLSVSATFDRDVPAVIVDRVYVVAAEDGRFSAILPYAPASEHLAVLSVQALTTGIAPATACCFPVGGPRTLSGSPTNHRL